ncbi:MAG: Fe(2+) transporter permease subunit FeoB [Gammaproteobacteria bacterium]
MKTAKVALLGNPNCGKSTLCNALTGSRLKVGHWPGVTVERHSGHFKQDGWEIEVVDLPGVYTLTYQSEQSSIDSRITCEAVLSEEFDLIVNILDASNLERNLYLTAQLLALQMPMLVVVNMLDVAAQQGAQLNLAALQATLGCPVVGVTATQPQPILKQYIIRALTQKTHAVSNLNFPDQLQTLLNDLTQQIHQAVPQRKNQAPFLALQLLEEDELAKQLLPADLQMAAKIPPELEPDIQIADTRYTFAHALSQKAIQQTSTQPTVSQKLDRIVLNRWLGIPIFFMMIYALFFFSINIGGTLQPFFDGVSHAVFIQGTAQLLTAWHAPTWLIGLISVGLGTSINTVVTFIPVIGAMFLFLAILESSGYMARAAFVVDRIMRWLGLPGKAFVPLIVGFGCNVPAILATRTLEQRRDRLLTLMMTPFMSCGARMAIYTVFTAAFFPTGGQNIVFGLYIMGILMAVMTGWLLRKTALQGDCSPWIIELPPYHVPRFRMILRQTWHRLHQFLFKAGKLIIPICLFVSFLNAIQLNGTLDINNSNSSSALSTLGKKITPVFAPMGIEADNWPATVGLLTGVLAKEVVVGTLNTLYTQTSHLVSTDTSSTDVWGELKDAVTSIPAQWIALKDSFSNPIAASSADAQVTPGVLGVMMRHFDGQIGALAYLLFVLLYFPCVSAVAALMRESNWRWAVFSTLWTTGLAYSAAVLFYQTMTWSRHPWISSTWIFGIVLTFSAGFYGLKWSLRTRSTGKKLGVTLC